MSDRATALTLCLVGFIAICIATLYALPHTASATPAPLMPAVVTCGAYDLVIQPHDRASVSDANLAAADATQRNCRIVELSR